MISKQACAPVLLCSHHCPSGKLHYNSTTAQAPRGLAAGIQRACFVKDDFYSYHELNITLSVGLILRQISSMPVLVFTEHTTN